MLAAVLAVYVLAFGPDIIGDVADRATLRELLSSQTSGLIVAMAASVVLIGAGTRLVRRRGLARLQPRFNRCARDYGGIDGTRISVDFSIEPDGSAAQSHARLPHSRTPLGRCVAATVSKFGSFSPSKEGLGDVRRDIVLHP